MNAVCGNEVPLELSHKKMGGIRDVGMTVGSLRKEGELSVLSSRSSKFAL